jgi:hypothetical protein
MIEHHDPMCVEPETCHCLDERDPWKRIARLQAQRAALLDALREIDEAAWKGNSTAAHPVFREKISNLAQAAIRGDKP